MSKKMSTGIGRKLFPIGTILFWMGLYVYVPILSPYAEFLSQSLKLVGLAVSAYGLGQLIFRLPIGIWSDKSGKRKPFVISGFVFTFISCIGMALFPNVWMLLIFRAVAGISAAMWVPFTVLYSSYFRDEEAPRAMSLITFCTGFGQMASSYLGGKLADMRGWTAPFYAGAGLSILGAILMLPAPESRTGNRTPFSMKKLLTVTSNRRLLLVSTITTLSQFSIFITTFGFLSIYATRIGATKTDLGIMMLIINMCQTASMFLTGIFVFPRIGYRATIGIAYATAAVATFYTPYIQDIHLLFLVQGLGSLGRGLAYPLLMGLAIQGMPQDVKATAMGFFQAVYSIGMFLGPAAGGFIGDWFGLSGIFFCAGVVYLIAFVLSVYKLPKRIAKASS